MSETRKLTISVTINLGNNENLHLEVSDSAETIEDASSLRQYLVSVLDGFATNDAETRAAVDRYKTRVLVNATAPTVGSETDDEDDDDAFPVGTFGQSMEEDAYAPLPAIPMPIADAPSEPFAAIPLAPDVLAEPEMPASPQLPPAPLVEERREEFICSKCGAPVTKLQRDISMLFNNKILCKDCMK